MDPITKRSALIATCIHICLVALAFAPHGCSTVPEQPVPPPAESPTAQPKPIPKPSDSQSSSPTYAAVVAVPLSEPTTPPLPPLSNDDLPSLPAADNLIVPVRQDHAGESTTRGKEDSGTTAVDLPNVTSNAGDLISHLRGQKTSNRELNREQRMLATAQEFLHGRLQSQIERQWPHLLTKVTSPRLVIEIQVDKRSQVTYARLVTSSGSLNLDRLIDEWLKSSTISLPPITPGVTYPFLIVLRRP